MSSKYDPFADKRMAAAEYRERTAHTAGHLDRVTDHVPACTTCTGVYADRQRDILAAARVVRDSEKLQAMTPGSRATNPLGRFADSTFERAEIALVYVQNVHAQYASGEDFDNRFKGVYSEFQDYAEELAGEAIVDNLEATLKGLLKYADEREREGTMSLFTTMAQHFDYEGFARDLLLGGDYSEVRLDRSYQVAVFNNHG